MTQTMTKRRAKVGIHEAWCKGCGICVALCPLNILRLNDENKAYVENDVCNGCRLCERLCPDFALDIGDLDDSQSKAEAASRK